MISQERRSKIIKISLIPDSNNFDNALDLQKCWPHEADVSLVDPSQAGNLNDVTGCLPPEGTQVVFVWESETLSRLPLSVSRILLWDQMLDALLQEGKDAALVFDYRVGLRSQLLEASAVVVPSEAVRDSLWGRISRLLCPLVLSWEASPLHKLALMALNGRLAAWNLTRSRANHLFYQKLKDCGSMGREEFVLPDTILAAWEPGSLLLVHASEELAGVLEARGHQVLRHSYTDRDGFQTFATECIFAPTASFDYVVLPEGAEDLPHFDATLVELKRLTRKALVIGLRLGEPRQCQTWGLLDRDHLDQVLPVLAEGFQGKVVESGKDRVFVVLTPVQAVVHEA